MPFTTRIEARKALNTVALKFQPIGTESTNDPSPTGLGFSQMATFRPRFGCVWVEISRLLASALGVIPSQAARARENQDPAC